MENKSIKIIDDHGIDRVANVICGIDLDGSNYVIYWIERDNDNDNVFVSKLLSNNDGTFNMMNIEDSLEKNGLNDVVKELITNAINDDNDSLSSDSVMLKNGKNIKIIDVLFNKEQNINVQKTYITTVKKSVITVSEKYYHVNDNKVPEVQSVSIESQTIPSEVASSSVSPVPDVVMPALNEVVAEKPSLDVLPQVEVTSPTLNIQNVDVTPVSPVIPSVPSNENINVGEVKPEVNVVPSPIEPVSVTPVSSVTSVEPIPVTHAVMPEVKPANNVDVLLNMSGTDNNLNVVNSDVNNVPPVAPNQTDAFTFDSLTPVAPAVQAASVSADNNKLLFDGSKEVNLNASFGAHGNVVSNVPLNEVKSIRDFGQDDDVLNNASNGNSGFANSKFLTVVAIVFFMAACVFLGYEIFNYFQIK